MKNLANTFLSSRFLPAGLVHKSSAFFFISFLISFRRHVTYLKKKKRKGHVVSSLVGCIEREITRART
jgi:hypothetical protein